jgi:hypothetical protein
MLTRHAQRPFLGLHDGRIELGSHAGSPLRTRAESGTSRRGDEASEVAARIFIVMSRVS